MNTHDKRHILTVALEDYFQVGAFNRVIQRGQWYRFETRLEQNAERALALLDRHGVKATFFVLGWIADQFPELVRRVADRGHEIASKGYYHRGISQMTPAEFKEDLLRSREALEHACGRQVIGYRMADGWFRPEDLWALDSLVEVGYAYDSSIAPIGRQWAHEPFRRYLHTHEAQGGKLVELPISTASLAGLHVPIGGGNYFRQIPPFLIRPAIARWHRKVDAPLVLYFHVWELDPEQPTISASSLLTRIRHYRNLDKMEGYLDYFLARYRFTGAADYLGLSREPAAVGERCYPAPDLRPEAPAADDEGDAADRTPVTIVVPCYNEELIVPYLANTLNSVRSRLRDYSITFALVDDGSKDNTWAGLQATFGGKPGFELYRHEHNRGVMAAILTGIHRARTEIVCSMDCDCTYDPHELANMIPLLEPGVDLVTASPYHPEGGVRNVPGWRLKLSKTASWLYRRVLRQKLHTYTSCFRVYRRSAVLGIELTRTNFLGVAELIGRLDLQGSKIVEYPATLEVRMLGRSKMKTVRMTLGHLRLLARLLAARIRGAKRAAEALAAIEQAQGSGAAVAS
jgi:polysaccharide deacetylase family protein (PEP-CTERM system associated)